MKINKEFFVVLHPINKRKKEYGKKANQKSLSFCLS